MNYSKLLIVLAFAGVAACAPKVAKETASATTNTAVDASKDFRAMAPKPGAARPVKIGTSQQFTLANGLKVIVVENHKLPQISYQLSIDRDQILEKEKAGLASLAGSLLATGTSTQTKAQIDEAVDYIGASLSTNEVGGYASSLTKHTDKILSLFSQVVLDPAFNEAEFEKIKTQTLSGLQTEKDDPNAISGNVSDALTYGKTHPYGEIVNEITVSSVSLDDCKSYYNTYFKPGNAYLVIVGDITVDDARKKAEKYFGKWAAGKTPEYEYVMPKAVDKTQVAFVDKPGAVQSVINITYPVDLKPGTADVLPCQVMNTILGSGFSGRLFKNLREDKAYTYGAYSSLSTDELVGNFSANASVRNEVTDSAVTQFLLELDRLRSEPVTQAELDLAKSFIAGGFARSLESPQTVAGFALNIDMYKLPADYYETYLQRLEAVTINDVSRVAKKYITPGNARIIIVGNKDEVMDKLTAFDKEDGVIQLYDIYANPRKDESNVAVEMKATDIIEQYLKAIGGREKIQAVKSIDQTYSIDLMGQSLTSRVVQDEGKFYMTMTMQGMNLMKQVYDGEKGSMEAQGVKTPVEGSELQSLKDQAYLFPEQHYNTTGYTIETKGMEDVNGKSCYKLSVVRPSGNKSTEYYDKESGLKVKEIQTVVANGQSSTNTMEYSDYKMVEGIQVPHSISLLTPDLPMALVMKATAVKINGEVDKSLFKL
jgi:predicted Zn-dependent peptidase